MAQYYSKLANGSINVAYPNKYVGIGTTEPSYPLDITGYGNSSIGFRAGNYTILNETGNETSFGNTAYYGVSFKTNNAVRLKITNAGNVGIGTTNPYTKLQVDNTLGVYSTDTTTGGQIYLGSSDFYNPNYYNSAPGIGAIISTGCSQPNGLGFYTYTGSANSRTERMRIEDNGEVGIGTTNPARKLHVKDGDINIDAGYNYYWNSGDAAIRSNGCNIMLETYTGSALTEKVRIQADGNVGIGGSPASVTHGPHLDIVGNRGTLTVGTGYFEDNGTTNFLNGARPLAFGYAGSEKMRINFTGNVGIGTTNPAYKLDVSGTLATSSDVRIGYPNTCEDQDSRLIVSYPALSGVPYDFITLASTVNNAEQTGRIVWKNRYETSSFATGQEASFIGSYRCSSAGCYSLIFGTTGSNASDAVERVRIDHNGNVGIGTTNPDTPLHIWSTGTASPVFKAERDDTSDFITMDFGAGEANLASSSPFNLKYGAIKYLTFSGADNSLRLGCNLNLTVTSTGNVGIGTTSPDYKLDIYGSFGSSAGAGLRLRSSATDDNGIIHEQADGTAWFTGQETSNPNDYEFWYNNGSNYSHIMHLDNSGSIGIGTTNPAYRTTIYGGQDEGITLSVGSGLNAYNFVGIGLAGYIAGNAANKAVFALERTGIYGTGKIHFLNDGALDNGDATLADSKLTIQNDGNVGIGTTSPTPVTGSLGLEVLGLSGAEIIVGSTNTVTVANEFVGGLAFRNNDGSGTGACTTPHYSGIKARSGDIYGNSTLEFYSGRGGYEADTPDMVMLGSTTAASGHVGIGTTNPSSKLDVVGSSCGALTVRTAHTNNPVALSVGGTSNINGVTSAGESFYILNVGEDSGSLKSIYAAGTITTARTLCTQYLCSTSNIITNGALCGCNGNNAFKLHTDTDRVYIVLDNDASDGIGVGGDYLYIAKDGTCGVISNTEGNLQLCTGGSFQLSSVCSSALYIQLQNAGNIRGYIHANSGNSVGFLDTGGSWAIRHANDAGTWFYDCDGTNRAYIGLCNYFCGNVGIGTTTPSDNLHVFSSSDPTIKIGGGVSEGTTGGTATLQWRANNGTVGNIFAATYYKDANQDRITFWDGGNVDVLTLKNGGNVGIGITNPADKLHIQNGGTSGGIKLSNSGADNYILFSNGVNNWYLSQDGNDNSGSPNSFQINRDGSTYVMITSAGDVGIGTTQPANRLDIALPSGETFKTCRSASAWFSLSHGSATTVMCNGGELQIHATNSTVSSFRINSSLITLNEHTISNCCVGIGTSAPTAWLQVGQNTDNDATDYGICIAKNGTSTCPGVYQPSALKIQDYAGDGPSSGVDIDGIVGIHSTRLTYADTNAANVSYFHVKEDSAYSPMRLDGKGNLWLGYDRGTQPTNAGTWNLITRGGLVVGSSYQSNYPGGGNAIISGCVGIGTTSPSYKLHVAGDAYVTGTFYMAGNKALNMGGASQLYYNTTTAGLQFTGSTGNNTVFIKASDGNVGIGTTNPTEKLHVCGNISGCCVITGAIHERNLRTLEIKGSTEGTVLIWENGKAVPSYNEYDSRVLGIVGKDSPDPIVMGAEPVLITGSINEGDFIVTSNVSGHGMRAEENGRNLFGKVIGQALQAGAGDSHTIMAMIRKL